VCLAIVVLGLLSLLEGSGQLRLGRVGLAPDLVLSAVIAWAFLSDSSNGALWGFVGGLMLDSLSSGPFGAYALALGAVGALVGGGRLSLYADVRTWGAVVGASGAALFYALLLLLMALSGWGAPLLQTVRLIVLPAVAMDTICVVLLITPMRALQRRFPPSPATS
jgi:rod shape-determining protein MreD